MTKLILLIQSLKERGIGQVCCFVILLLFNELRAPVCKNQTKSKFRGKGGKFDFFHILMLDRLGYN